MIVSLEDYKKKVEECLMSSPLNLPQERISNLMKIYEKAIQEAYEDNWEVENIAYPMVLGY